MKIVHVASYNYLKDGQTYYATDYKIHQGLVRNGHFVYPFSYRDNARCGNIFGSKSWGIGKTNKRLVNTCKNINPELLLLAHAEFITLETLQEIKTNNPNIKIAMWFVDALFNERNVVNIKSKLPAIDALFVTTGGELLKQFENGHTKVHFMPNLVDSSIDIHRNFEKDDGVLEIDFLFCGTDYKDPERTAFLQKISDELSSINAKFYGCLGNKPIFGNEYISTLGKTKMALNYSRRNDIELYSSDRIAHLTGNGILTFTPRIPKFETLYTEDEVVYFDTLDELIEKVLHYNHHTKESKLIASNGHKKALGSYNSSAIAKLIIDSVE